MIVATAIARVSQYIMAGSPPKMTDGISLPIAPPVRSVKLRTITMNMKVKARVTMAKYSPLNRRTASPITRATTPAARPPKTMLNSGLTSQFRCVSTVV